jgi:hypothetical protein
MVLPPPMQSSLPAGWLAFTGRELNPLDRYKRFQTIHPPFLDLAWRKGSFIVASPSREGSCDHLVGAAGYGVYVCAPPGRRTVKAEPLPGSLVTVTSPPIMRASLRLMERPRPVLPKRCAVGLLKPWPSVLTPRSTVSATREPFY